jgi:hypothetical protein
MREKILWILPIKNFLQLSMRYHNLLLFLLRILILSLT